MRLIHVRACVTRVGLTALFAAVIHGCASTPVQFPTFDEAARGREDFRRSCASCHGTDGRGGSGPDLTRLAVTMGDRFSHQYVLDVITGAREYPAHGPRDMPVWRDRLADVDSGAEAAGALWMQRRLDALATYVESLQVGVEPGDQR